MTKVYFILGLLIAVMPPVASAQPNPKETNDYLTMRTPPPEDDAANSISIHQEIDFKANPQRVYEALLDSKQFGAMAGKVAEINREVGGAFSLFGGHIIGRNLELIPNQRIVQAWRAVTWPEGIYSIARFELKPQGSGTHLVFDHIGFPAGLHDHLAEGWETNYWKPLQKSLDETSSAGTNRGR